MKIQYFMALVVLSLATVPGARAAATTTTWTGADPSGYWSAPANWSPAGVPTNGNDLVFPGGLPPDDMMSTNDLTGSFFRSITFGAASRHTIRGNPMTLTNRSDCIINSGTNVMACDLTFSGTPATPQYFVKSIHGYDELTLGNVGGGSLSVYFGMRVVITGQFTGGTVRVWGGNLALHGGDPSAGSVEVQNSSTLFVQGSRPNLNITMFWEFESAACPFLSGDGVVGDVLGCGHIILDSTLSVKSLGGRGASTYGWRVLDIRLNGTNVGEYGRLISSGEVTLSGGSLSASPGFNPQPGQVFTIVDKISPGPITTVPGYGTALFGPEGSLTILNGKAFRLSYVGGDGNDVTLTVESNRLPAVTITNPPAGAVFNAPASFSLEASASDPDGSVSQVQFFLDSTSLGTDTVSPYSANVNNLAAGTYTLSAVVTDNQNARATNSITVVVNNCVAVPSGLVAWWRAEGNANDAAGAHDGQLRFGAAFAQGRTGQAFSFDGVRSRVSIPDSDAFKLTNSLTFEGWLQPASWAPGIIFIRGDDWGGFDPYYMGLTSSGHLHWGITAEDNSFADIQDPNTLPIGVWTHVAGVLNGANGDLDLYVNGSLVSHTNTPLRPLRNLDTNPSLQAAVGIGNAGGTFHDFPYHGLIDEWSLYGRALSGQEILGIYQAGASGKCTINQSLVVTWQQPANYAAFPSGFTISLRARATGSDGTVSNVVFFATPTNGPTIYVGQGTLASDGYYVRGWTNPPPGQYQLHAEAVDNVGGRGISDPVQIVVVGTNQPTNSVAQTRTWTGADPSGYWSAPANWSPAGVLVNGDALVFPGGLPPGDMMSTNDLTGRFFRSITFSGASRHTIRGNPITLTNLSNCIINSGTNVMACDVTFSGTPPAQNYEFGTIGGSGELRVIGNVGGGSLFFYSSGTRLIIMGQFTGGSLNTYGGTLALYGDNPYAVTARVQYCTFLVQGSQPNLNLTMDIEMEGLTCPTLSGDGVVGDVTGCGYITPDSTLSVKNLSLGNSRGVLDIHLNGTNAGEYGRLVASGSVSLGRGRLFPSAGFNPQAGQIYTIVEKTSPGPIANAIFGPEGTITNLNGMPFRISYVGGDGNDVTLTATDTRPTVTITNPPNGAVFEPPASFTLGAAAGGSVTNVQFFLDATSLGNDTSSPYSVPVSGLVAGNYTLTAVASDDAGRHATNSIAITVQVRTVWDVSQDFSLTANPGGPWSYGYMNVLGGAFSLLTHSQYAPDNNGLMIFLWSKNGYEPVAVFKNQTSQTSISDGGSGTFPPGTVWFSGGVEGHVDNYGVIRFTVPADKAGTYHVETAVRTYLDGPASRDADFWVLRNGTQVFSHFLGPNSGTGYTNIFTLAAGDTIDFVCGRGQDNIIHGSGLKIRATLTRTDQPAIVLGAVQQSFGTQFVFSYSADVGLRYAVERSATLSNWTTIWSNTANVNPMTVTDTAATNGMNFYRVRRLPNP